MVALSARDKADYVSGRRLYAVGVGFLIASILCVALFAMFEYIEQNFSPRGFFYVNAKVKTLEVNKEDGLYKASYSYEYLVPRYYVFTSNKEKLFETEKEAKQWIGDRKVGDELKVSYNEIVPEYTTVGSVSKKPYIINYIAPVGFVVFGIIGFMICREAGRILRNNREFKE